MSSVVRDLVGPGAIDVIPCSMWYLAPFLVQHLGRPPNCERVRNKVSLPKVGVVLVALCLITLTSIILGHTQSRKVPPSDRINLTCISPKKRL